MKVFTLFLSSDDVPTWWWNCSWRSLLCSWARMMYQPDDGIVHEGLYSVPELGWCTNLMMELFMKVFTLFLSSDDVPTWWWNCSWRSLLCSWARMMYQPDDGIVHEGLYSVPELGWCTNLMMELFMKVFTLFLSSDDVQHFPVFRHTGRALGLILRITLKASESNNHIDWLRWCSELFRRKGNVCTVFIHNLLLAELAQDVSPSSQLVSSLNQVHAIHKNSRFTQNDGVTVASGLETRHGANFLSLQN